MSLWCIIGFIIWFLLYLSSCDKSKFTVGDFCICVIMTMLCPITFPFVFIFTIIYVMYKFGKLVLINFK